MKSSLFENTEVTSQEHRTFVQQNNNTLLVNLDGEVLAKQGSMSAYQGDIDFVYEGGGIKRMFKKVATGESLRLMRCRGKGDVFFADNGAQVHVVDLEDEQITISSRSLVAFDAGLQWDINFLRAGIGGLLAGGLFNTTLTGTGSAAVSSWGTPVVLHIDQPTYVDVNCAIAWSTSLEVSIKSTFKAQALIGRGSGEVFQMAFSGEGFVVVQPGEGPMAMVSAASSR